MRPSRGRLKRRSALLCLAAALTGGSAHAAEKVVTAPVHQGPRLSGSKVAWSEQVEIPTGFEWTLRLAAPGEAPTVLATDTLTIVDDPVPGASSGESTSFGISDGALALFSSSSGGGLINYSNTSLAAGPLSGPLTGLGGCAGGIGTVGALAYDLEGTRIAYRVCPDTDVLVRDLAAGEEIARLDAGGTPFRVDLSGNFVSWTRSMSDAVVHDLQAGANSYTHPRALSVLLPDGRTVTCEEGRLLLYSPAEPFAHPIGGFPCTPEPTGLLRAVDGGVVFMGESADGPAVRLADLSGNARDLLIGRSERWDAAGSRFTWLVPACSGPSEIFVTDLRSSTVERLPDPSCPLEIGRRMNLPRRGVTAKLRVRCREGCSASLVARRRRRQVGLAGFVLEPSQRFQAVDVDLGKAAARLARRRGRLRVGVSVRVENTDGTDRVVRRGVSLRAARKRGA